MNIGLIVLAAVGGAVLDRNIGVVDKAIKLFDGIWSFLAAWAKKLFPKS